MNTPRKRKSARTLADELTIMAAKAIIENIVIPAFQSNKQPLMDNNPERRANLVMPKQPKHQNQVVDAEYEVIKENK